MSECRHICIAGAGSTIGAALMTHYLEQGEIVTGICRDTEPNIASNHLELLMGVDWALGDEPTLVKHKDVNLDVLITCMGTVDNARLDRMALDSWEMVVRDTLTSVFSALNWGIPRMTLVGGNVVVLGSIVGSSGGYGCANYAAAKAGLVGLVRAASNEYARKGILVNLLELGYVNVGMGANLEDRVRERIDSEIPMGHFGSVADVVLAVDFLSRTRYATGTCLNLAGGLR